MRTLRSSEKVKYGYVKNAIVAIDDGLAFALSITGPEIYMLYDDNTERLAESTQKGLLSQRKILLCTMDYLE